MRHFEPGDKDIDRTDTRINELTRKPESVPRETLPAKVTKKPAYLELHYKDHPEDRPKEDKPEEPKEKPSPVHEDHKQPEAVEMPRKPGKAKDKDKKPKSLKKGK